MQEPTVYCRACGRPMQARDSYCPHCGQAAFPGGQPNSFGQPTQGGQPGPGFQFSEAAPERMGFAQAVGACFRKYAEFEGRASRSEYWWFALFGLLVVFAEGLFSVPMALRSLVSLAMLLPSLAVTARRLHDVDRSGWHQLWSLTFIGLFFPLLYWLVQPGKPAVNRFGAPPAA